MKISSEFSQQFFVAQKTERRLKMNKKYIGILALTFLVFASFGFVSAAASSNGMGSNDVPAGFYRMSVYGGDMISDGMRGYEFCQSKGFKDFCLIDRKILTQQYTALNTGAQGVLSRGFSGKPYLLYSNNEDTLLACTNNLIKIQEKRDEESGMFTEIQDHIVCGDKNQASASATATARSSDTPTTNTASAVPKPSTGQCRSVCSGNNCKICEGSTARWVDSENNEFDLSLDYISSSPKVVKISVEDSVSGLLQENDEFVFGDNRLHVSRIYPREVAGEVGYANVQLFESSSEEPQSSCTGNTCVLYEGQTVNLESNQYQYEVSIDFISTTETKLNLNGEITNSLREGQVQRLSDGRYVSIVDIQARDVAGEVGMVKFKILNRPGFFQRLSGNVVA